MLPWLLSLQVVEDPTSAGMGPGRCWRGAAGLAGSDEVFVSKSWRSLTKHWHSATAHPHRLTSRFGGDEATKGSRLPSCRWRTEYTTCRLPSKEHQEGKVLEKEVVLGHYPK